MKIRLTDIPQEGLNVNDTLSLENINARMNEGPENDILFTAPPAVTVFVTKDKGGAHASGKATSKIQQICPKCTEKVEHNLQVDLDIILKPKTTESNKKEDWNDDIGIVYFDGEHIDLEDIIQETLILDISPYGMPHDGCKNILKEISPEESKKETKTNLGELLKDAGIK